MKSYISSRGIAVPEHFVSQMKIAEFMAEDSQMNEAEQKKLYALYRASGIQKRYSVIPDFGSPKGSFEFFPNKSTDPFPTTSARIKLYEKTALPLALNAINDALKKSKIAKNKITHLITVSCTGMYAPGIDIDIVQNVGLNKNTERVCINYMGCYASFNALKIANSICLANRQAVALIVSVELCTIHYQNNKNPDIILSNALFGDGAAAVVIEGQKPKGISLSLDSFYCDLMFEGKKEMAWHISDSGFAMALSSYVPELIKNGIRKLTHNLLNGAKVNIEDIEYFAIHPGGKKILEAIENELGISKNKNQYAYHVLKEYGNMSSPTILFVLYFMMNDLDSSCINKNILSFAFGPGLTLESMFLKICYGQSNSKDNAYREFLLGSTLNEPVNE